MRAFDLWDAQAGAPICTRKGWKAKLVEVDGIKGYCVCVDVTLPDGEVSKDELYDCFGNYQSAREEHFMDLMMEE